MSDFTKTTHNVGYVLLYPTNKTAHTDLDSNDNNYGVFLNH